MTADDLRRDAFLGGRLQIWQPRSGYRAGMDPVLLAASCPARPGHRVLDVGCGVGTAALCLGARVEGLVLYGVEQVPQLAALAVRNATENGHALRVITADATDPPPALKALGVEHVLMNPPYFSRDAGSPAPDPLREAAMGVRTPLAALVKGAARRLVPGGYLSMVHRADALGDVLRALEDAGLGSVTVLPLWPRAGRMARLMLIRARKGGKAPLRLRAGVVLHDGPEHSAEGQDFTGPIEAVLRDGAPLPGFD